ILSGVTVSMLFSPLMALPSGGKFTHGTSGTITSGNGHMQINGNGTNSVIQWGGGFNIGKGESVNFGGPGKNYLNIAHGAGKSTIEGILNAGGNNVFLINPNGVIIEKSGSIINAKNFMASTATLSNDDFNTFKNLSFDNPQAFSPKIKPNNGNVVNLGKINATNSITLQGNKIVLEAGFDKGSLNKIETNELNLKGNEVYADVGTTKVQKVNVEANKGTLYLSATGYYYDPTKKYDEFNNVNNNLKKTYNQYISIGSVQDWWHFAKGWNEKAGFRNNVVGNTFKLTNDINFGGNQGKNYANYCIEGLGCTNMIVGFKDGSAFNKTFDGQGYTLENINIDTVSDEVKDKPRYVGLFGKANGATFKNINVDYMNGSINAKSYNDNGANLFMGGFIGVAIHSDFSNINLKEINSIKADVKYGYESTVGGFAGIIDTSKVTFVQVDQINEIFGHKMVGGFVGSVNDSDINHIGLYNIDNIIGNEYIGGFVGHLAGGKFDDIQIYKINSIKVKNQEYKVHAGGFLGYAHHIKNATFNNIKIDTINSIESTGYREVSLGGFAGYLSSRVSFDFNNIALNNIGSLKAITTVDDIPGIYLGGFIGQGNSLDVKMSNIYINFQDNSKFEAINHKPYGGKYNYVGKVFGKYSTPNYSLNNVHVYHKNGILTNATSDSKYYGNSNDKIQIHTYNNQSDSVYKDFENKFNSIQNPLMPSITKPAEKEYLSAQEAKNDQATLTQDDLYKDIVNNIFDSLKGHSYAIDLNTLEALLQAYDNLIDTKSKVEFLSNFLLDKSKYQDKEERENLAHSLVQSMDFILAYSKNDAKDSKFESGVEDTFVKLKAEAVAKHSNALEQGEALKAYVKSLIDPVSSIKNNNEAITNNNTSIKDLQDEYNSLANSINKGLLDEDELSIAQKRLREIVASIEVLLEKNKVLKTNNDELLTQIEENHQEGNFRTYGVSSSTPETPTLSAVILNPGTNNGNDNNGDTSNGSDASQVVSSIQKQNSDKLGNAAVVDEEEKNEVEEASLVQKGKICIVSDNSKAMNPCIVSSF
ncbi:filamentous hemagglutinin N-terminal domain-containing protein, partial [Campylobacter lari]|nr:filamentous hemagglutinin N-terminal domain-containing protein [Campylobacter lari]